MNVKPGGVPSGTKDWRSAANALAYGKSNPVVSTQGGVPMRLQEFMNTRIITASPDESADSAWARMRNKRIRHLVVMDGKRMVGVVSDRDLGGRNGAAARRGRSVRDLMSAAPASATPSTTLRQAANLMRGRLIGSLPVLQDGQVVGIVTATDVLDELGRGATRPEVRAQRRSMRMAPASGRLASARRQAKRTARQSQKAASARSKDDAPERPPVTGRNTPTLGRTRVRQPDSDARAPMPAVTAREFKLTGARGSPAQIPAYIHGAGTDMDAHDKAYLRRKLGRRLGKFAPDIERTSVRLADINGPRGGVDRQCRIKVTLRSQPSVVVESRESSMQGAMDGALAMVVAAVTRAMQQRRTILRKQVDLDVAARATDLSVPINEE